MAEIPVEKKSAFPFWLIPAALIALLAIGALAYTMNTPPAADPVVNTQEERTEVTRTETNTLNQDRIVDVTVFSTTAQKLDLVGREVVLKDVAMGRVLSDRVFTVVSGDTEFFALLDPQLDNAGGNEERVAIKPGETRSLVGEFTTVPSADMKEEQRTDLPLDSAEYKALQNEQVYLHVSNLTN